METTKFQSFFFQIAMSSQQAQDASSAADGQVKDVRSFFEKKNIFQPESKMKVLNREQDEAEENPPNATPAAKTLVSLAQKVLKLPLITFFLYREKLRKNLQLLLLDSMRSNTCVYFLLIVIFTPFF